MLKGAYILCDDIHQNATGINKKVLAQIDVFRQSGFNIKEIYQIFPDNIRTKITNRLPGLSPKWEYTDELKDCDFIYLRRPYFMSEKFISFLQKVKKQKTTIIMEIPTYPYDLELRRPIKLLPFYIKDKHYRKKLIGLVDRLVTLTEDKEIFGIETLRISNGYDFNKMPLRSILADDTIDLCCVAYFEPWHGYERLIEGLKKYKMSGGNRKIKLHFVGEGLELYVYKKLVIKYGLQDCVVFYGIKSSEELSEIYSKCDFGVGSLGSYKKNLFFSCELKMREYIAVGLPMIVGLKTDFHSYPELGEYLLEYPNDDSFIDFDRIIDCYDLLYANVADVEDWALFLRNFGIAHFGMEKAMQEVIEYLNCEIGGNKK